MRRFKLGLVMAQGVTAMGHLSMLLPVTFNCLQVQIDGATAVTRETWVFTWHNQPAGFASTFPVLRS